MSGTVRRSLGFWRCWGLVVGGTIGSAVFMMQAVMAPYGGLGLLSLMFATLGAVFVALMFGTLERRVTTTGGMYAYTRAGVGDFAAFLVAWSGLISMWVSCAALAIGFVAYLGVARSGEYVNEQAHPPIVERDLWNAAQEGRTQTPAH